MGSPSQLTRAQVAMLKEVSDGRPVLRERIEPTEEGGFSRRFDIRENDVWFVELKPVP
jgi:xylan 1,4-beta-xylosidase